MKRVMQIVLFVCFIFGSSNSFAETGPGKCSMGEDTFSFFSCMLKGVYCDGISIEKFDNVKKIVILDPGKKYDATKSGVGKLEFVRRDGKRVVMKRCSMDGDGYHVYITKSLKFKIRNPVTDEIDYRSVRVDKIRSIIF